MYVNGKYILMECLYILDARCQDTFAIIEKHSET